jgi:hypothetical protein
MRNFDFRIVLSAVALAPATWFIYAYFFSTPGHQASAPSMPVESPAWSLLKESETRPAETASSSSAAPASKPKGAASSTQPMTPWTQLTMRQSLAAWYQSIVESGDNNALAAGRYVSAFCVSPDSTPSAQHVEGMIQTFYGQSDANGRLAAELTMSKQKLKNFCSTAPSGFNTMTLTQTAPTPYSRLMIRRNGYDKEPDQRQLLIEILSNPQNHSLAFNEWLSSEMWQGVGKVVGPTYTYAQRAYAEDTLMLKAVGPASDDSFRAVMRCALFAKCSPATVLTHQQKADVDGLIAYVEDNMRQQRWDKLL